MISSSISIKTKDFIFVLIPIAIFVLGDLIFDLASNWSIKIPQKPSTMQVFDEAINRYGFLTTQFAFAILSISVFSYFWFDISRSFLPEARRKIASFYIVLCLIMIVMIWRPQCDFLPDWVFGSVCSALPQHTYYLLDKEFFKGTLVNVKLSQTTGPNMFGVYLFALKVMNISAFLAVPALIVGSVSALGRAQPGHSGDEKRTGSPWAHANDSDTSDEYDNVFVLGYQADRLKTYLFLSSFVLIGVVIQMIFWMQLPSFALDKEIRASYDGLVRSITTYYGLIYAILLCSYYIPPCIILSRRMHNAAKQQLVKDKELLTVKNIRQWESKMGLQVIDFKSYKIIAALLSPLLPGIIGSVLGVFGGAK